MLPASPQPKRILVYGVTGSGKTTLAAKISERTGIPWQEVDQITWEPGWQQVGDEEQTRRIAEIVERESWVLDTAYGKWLEIPLARAEVIVALDYPRWFSLARLVRRSLARAIDKKPVCNGNTETWRNMFSVDSIILWHFRSWKRKRQRIRSWMKDPTKPPIIQLKSDRETEEWLKTLTPSFSPPAEGQGAESQSR